MNDTDTTNRRTMTDSTRSKLGYFARCKGGPVNHAFERVSSRGGMMAASSVLLGGLFILAPLLLGLGLSVSLVCAVIGIMAVACALTMGSRTEAFCQSGAMPLIVFTPPVATANVTIDSVSLTPLLEELTAAKNQEQNNSTERKNQLDALNGSVDDLETLLATANQTSVDIDAAIDELKAANSTENATLDTSIKALQAANDSNFSTLADKHDALLGAVQLVEAAVAGLDTDNAGVIAAVDSVKSSVDTLQTTAGSIVTALADLKTDVTAADANNVAALGDVQTAIADLQTANTSDTATLSTSIGEVKDAINAAATQAAADSATTVAELTAISTLLSTGNGDRVTLITKAEEIITSIEGIESALVTKMNELLADQLSEDDSVAVVMKIDTEVVDARLAEQIATIPAGVKTFDALITTAGSSGNQLSWSDDGGTTWKLLASGIGFSTESFANVGGFDVGEYPEMLVKFPLGSYGQVMAANRADGNWDVTVAEVSGGGSPSNVAFTVSGGTPVDGDYVDTGEVDNTYNTQIYTNGSVFFSDSYGNGGFYTSLADAQASGATFGGGATHYTGESFMTNGSASGTSYDVLEGSVSGPVVGTATKA